LATTWPVRHPHLETIDMPARLPFTALCALALGASALAGQAPPAFELTTSDGVRIPATALRSEETVGRPWVLLFHQDGASGLAEYATIAPRLHAMGLNVLLVDQRRGGDLFGGSNAVAAAFDANETSYCDARRELDAALDYARRRDPGQRAILWGSSYSAALVIRLAAERGADVGGVLAFSPASGEPMDGCRPEPVAAQVTVPLLVVRPASELEHGWIAEQLALFEGAGHRTLVVEPGRHGSSTLVPERVGSDTSEAWAVVEAFLRSLPGVPGGAR
jgi:alpha-beta hydrolase superfamily lysophospholipase